MSKLHLPERTIRQSMGEMVGRGRAIESVGEWVGGWVGGWVGQWVGGWLGG